MLVWSVKCCVYLGHKRGMHAGGWTSKTHIFELKPALAIPLRWSKNLQFNTTLATTCLRVRLYCKYTWNSRQKINFVKRMAHLYLLLHLCSIISVLALKTCSKIVCVGIWNVTWRQISREIPAVVTVWGWGWCSTTFSCWLVSESFIDVL